MNFHLTQISRAQIPENGIYRCIIDLFDRLVTLLIMKSDNEIKLTKCINER